MRHNPIAQFLRNSYHKGNEVTVTYYEGEAVIEVKGLLSVSRKPECHWKITEDQVVIHFANHEVASYNPRKQSCELE